MNTSYVSHSDMGEEDAMDGVVYKVTNAVLGSIFEENLLPSEILAKLE